MALQVANQFSAGIDRMFARRNLPQLYERQKAVSEETAALKEGGDSVSFSSGVPSPLSARDFEAALETGKAMAGGSRLSADTVTRLRADRVFTAVSALALMGATGEASDPLSGWPGGIPAPTSEELEAARRRLTQRLSDPSQADNPEAAMEERVELLRRVGKEQITAMHNA